ncbi:MAG: hypothetical protein R2702_03615 [Acidimicrobiales bacterium]
MKFAVQQVETGKWLINPANPPGNADAEVLPADTSTLRFQGNTMFAMNGEYTNGRWRMPLRLSATDAMNRAGEYAPSPTSTTPCRACPPSPTAATSASRCGWTGGARSRCSSTPSTASTPTPGSRPRCR